MENSSKRGGTKVGFRGTLEERFWRKVDKSSGCWIWTASRNAHGYGHFWDTKNVVLAHRFAWELFRGPIPEGMVLDHDNLEFGCGNPSCVRPDHLELVEQVTNMRRGRHLKKSNSSGHRGIRWRDRRWRVRVRFCGKEISGGSYLSLDDAIAARDALHIQLYGEVMHEKERT